jgi:CheY-specific phosphatase CheX
VAADRHFVRLLFNKVEVTPPGMAVGQPLTLADFVEVVMKPFALSPGQFDVHCAASGEKPIAAIDTSSI